MNLSAIKTPGVYIDEVSLLPPSVAGVETGIPAFVGYTHVVENSKKESLILKPVRISAQREFEEIFGTAHPEDDLLIKVDDVQDKDGNLVSRNINAGFKTGGGVNKNNLYYSIQLYFANGGGPCYIVSVGECDGTSVSDTELIKGVQALNSEDEPTMIVVPEATNTTGEGWRGIYNAALEQAARLKDRVAIMDVKQTAGTVKVDMDAFRDKLVVDYLKYGAAYYPNLDTTVDIDYSGKEADVKIEHKIKKAKADDSGFDDVPSTFDTLAKLNPPAGSAAKGDNLLFNQCVNALRDIPITLPPSSAMAGVYARVDRERGVWKAPANVGVASILGPSRKITDFDQDLMNVDATTGQSVNAIRTITGRGTVVWGARTLDGNSNEWRYIPVRRYFNYVEESVKKATYRFVFEPNDANTWVKIRSMIENFLTLQWRDGALQGAKPEDAFFVRVGLGQTMSEVDIFEGRLIVEIGMAVVRPAEFIILRFMHKAPVS